MSSTRKVRRLRDRDQVDSNPLFLPWNDDGERVHPHSRRHIANAFLNNDPGKVARIQHTIPQKSNHETRGNRSITVNRSLGRTVVHNEADEKENFGRMSTRERAFLSDAVTQITHDASDHETSSIYHTAVEESFSQGDGAESEFELNSSFNQDSLNTSPMALRCKNRVRQHPGGSRGALEALRPLNADNPGRQQVAHVSNKGRMQTSESSQTRQDQEDESFHPHHPGQESDLEIDLERLRISLRDFSHDDAEQEGGRGKRKAFGTQSENSQTKDEGNCVKPLSPRKEAPLKVKAPTKGKAKKTAKKAFDAEKHSIAEQFLLELDTEITHGEILKMTKLTGGVKLVWSKTLNTTAGRANWKREMIRSKQADGMVVAVSYKHHASIELAEKVIDDENRLLNVLAHEFCHLANFMVTGVTDNPHGKEFKKWAAKCSLAFGNSRGIKVTTKHTYDIDFKYVWECTGCSSEYKRHSKSIEPHRHRCGSCGCTLKQTKPVPRGGGAASGKPSAYQIFVKEQMRIVRGENPGSPQKEVLRIVAKRWADTKEHLPAASKIEVGKIENKPGPDSRHVGV
ncbi:hypothetical protein DCS_03673 [Drechmeria coniospora]|uniref:SprT-like domain-containing protein n=1 Tax=Drechmeria coniospora TaxID=98403 RepID=A0A151GI07_DRECN|nr:hypothetical protein DCS_03673 [Drechmeria coniospora]KYK56671.1 hypothetical protein DCS_03673 [Drechmeria coniospora]